MRINKTGYLLQYKNKYDNLLICQQNIEAPIFSVHQSHHRGHILWGSTSSAAGQQTMEWREKKSQCIAT